jgi:MFS family permease|uniref:MFS transporter n=1 Tax=Candidatus Planktophila sp. TaxID=2175601 RepID=UPI00404B4BA2
MKRYRELFAFPQVIRLGIAAFPARLAYGMLGLGIFFKAQQATGSFAIAGFAIGLASLATASTAGIRGSIMDRWGQKWPLRILVPSYTILVLNLNQTESTQAILISAFVLGITAPPINLSVRPLWKDIVPPTYLRTAYAFDSAMMSSTKVIGPVLVTALALSTRPYLALNAVAALLFIGGLSLALTPVSRNWIPEKKDKGQDVLLKNRAIQLLMFEGCFIGFGWGVFDVSIPAFAIQENVPHRVAWIFAAFGLANVIGGLLGGLVSKKLAPLSALRRAYFLWSIACIPIAFTYPDWTMALVGASIGFLGGAVQVFYFEVLEAVRPKGSQVSSLGWIWSVEGMFIALGAAVGGIVSEHLSPRIGLGLLPFMIFIGFIILTIGMGRLSTANNIPTEAEDLAAIENLSDPNK